LVNQHLLLPPQEKQKRSFVKRHEQKEKENLPKMQGSIQNKKNNQHVPDM